MSAFPLSSAVASLTSRAFGVLSDGRPVEAWTLCGAGGMQLEVLTYGAIVTRLLVPDESGRLADVVLGFDTLDSYLGPHPYFGALIGRTAGRLSGAGFRLDGQHYELPPNDAPNHLHGGAEGFDKKLWTTTQVECADGGSSLRLALRSQDGEEGYPGAVDVTVTYTVDAGNTLWVETEAACDRATPVNLTQHMYFNLCGEPYGTVADHELQIFADEFVPTDERMTLLGRLESVAGRDNDFRKPRRLGDALPQLHQSHGDLYLLRKSADGHPGSGLVPAARLFCPCSGRELEVSTTSSYMQLYTGSGLDSTLRGKSGVTYGRHAGLCLECENYPDGANQPSLGDIVLRPGNPRRETTAYKFNAVRPCARGLCRPGGTSALQRGV